MCEVFVLHSVGKGEAMVAIAEAQIERGRKNGGREGRREGRSEEDRYEPCGHGRNDM